MIKAVKVSSYVQTKEGQGKGKRFYIFNVIGTPEEIAEYVNCPQFKQYPLHAQDGTPQFRTMYPPLMDTCPLYKKQDGNYALDESEINDDLARMNDDRVKGTALESMFAQKIAGKIGLNSMFNIERKSTMPTEAVKAEETKLDDIE